MEKGRRRILVSCGSCDVERIKKICIRGDGKGGKDCPTLKHRKILLEVVKEYEKPKVREFARQASIQEGEGYANRHQRPYVRHPAKTRIEEICEFAKKMDYTRLGLAFCVGLSDEGEVVEEIFKANGFEVVSVICKAGRSPKESIGVRDEEKVCIGSDEAMCNPVFQAKLLNHAKADFNVLLGLCVGHDSLFFKYSEAPTTVLAVKDRVTGHNPLAAVYLSQSYYGRLKSNR